MHLYPKNGQLPADLKLLKASGGQAGGDRRNLPTELHRGRVAPVPEGSRKDAAGWIGFYWGQTPDELAKSGTVGDALTAAWLKLFQELKNPTERRAP